MFCFLILIYTITHYTDYTILLPFSLRHEVPVVCRDDVRDDVRDDGQYHLFARVSDMRLRRALSIPFNCLRITEPCVSGEDDL